MNDIIHRACCMWTISFSFQSWAEYSAVRFWWKSKRTNEWVSEWNGIEQSKTIAGSHEAAHDKTLLLTHTWWHCYLHCLCRVSPIFTSFMLFFVARLSFFIFRNTYRKQCVKHFYYEHDFIRIYNLHNTHFNRIFRFMNRYAWAHEHTHTVHSTRENGSGKKYTHIERDSLIET